VADDVAPRAGRRGSHLGAARSRPCGPRGDPRARPDGQRPSRAREEPRRPRRGGGASGTHDRFRSGAASRAGIGPRRCPRPSPRRLLREHGERHVESPQVLSQSRLPLGVLRPVQEPVGDLVFDADLRQPQEDTRVPTPLASVVSTPGLRRGSTRDFNLGAYAYQHVLAGIAGVRRGFESRRSRFIPRKSGCCAADAFAGRARRFRTSVPGEVRTVPPLPLIQ
jgi:hypothetical protein